MSRSPTESGTIDCVTEAKAHHQHEQKETSEGGQLKRQRVFLDSPSHPVGDPEVAWLPRDGVASEAEAVASVAMKDVTDATTIEVQPHTEPPCKQPGAAQTMEGQPVAEPLHSQPGATQTIEGQPDDFQPLDTQPDDSQPLDWPLDETQPLDTQPDDSQPLDWLFDETQPIEAQPDDSQPQESQAL